MKKSEYLIILLVIISFALGWYFYPQLPERVASHWNEKGEVNGYMSRFWGAFILPVINLIMAVLFLIIPRIDPLKHNIVTFRKYFDTFVIIILLFMIYIYLLTIAWNLDYRFNLMQWMMPAMAVLFYFVGVMLKHTKRNWFIGIRTPWTLSSDEVWDKTHQLGGQLFKLIAVLTLASIFWPDYSIYIFLIPIFVVTIFIMIYSYYLFRKEPRHV